LSRQVVQSQWCLGVLRDVSSMKDKRLRLFSSPCAVVLLLCCCRVLEVLEFTSARKRMSVIVETDDGKVMVLAKGADTVRQHHTSPLIEQHCGTTTHTRVSCYIQVAECKS
jgi:magnesium-transporting ATPase (P-type)